MSLICVCSLRSCFKHTQETQVISCRRNVQTCISTHCWVTDSHDPASRAKQQKLKTRSRWNRLGGAGQSQILATAPFVSQRQCIESIVSGKRELSIHITAVTHHSHCILAGKARSVTQQKHTRSVQLCVLARFSMCQKSVLLLYHIML